MTTNDPSDRLSEIAAIPQSRLLAYARLRCRQRGLQHVDVQDLLQEAYLAACDALRSNPPSHRELRTALQHVVRNTIDSCCRRECATSRRLPGEDLVPIDEIPGENERINPALLAERAERSRLLLAAIAALPSEQTRLIKLVYFKSRSVVDAARRENISTAAAYRRLYAARSCLRQQLSEDAIDDRRMEYRSDQVSPPRSQTAARESQTIFDSLNTGSVEGSENGRKKNAKRSEKKSP